MKDLWQVLLHMSEGVKGESLSCEECFMFLDCLSDLLADGYPVKEVMPLADKYLKRCPDCEQEHLRSLLEYFTGRRRERRPPAEILAHDPDRERDAQPTGKAVHGGE